jgi:hypothetical protein
VTLARAVAAPDARQRIVRVTERMLLTSLGIAGDAGA